MFSIDVRGLPTINSYLSALSKYESIKPIRGSDNHRPLEDRRKQHVSINMTKAIGIDGAQYPAIGFKLYETNVVIFLSNGEVHFDNGGFSTVSTNAFASRIMPAGVYVCNHHGDSMVTAGDNLSKIQTEEGVPVKLYETTYTSSILGTTTQQWRIHNPTTPYGYYVNRKRLTIENRRAKPFKEFCKNMALILGVQTNYNRAGAYTTITAEKLYNAMVDEDQWAGMAELLLGRAFIHRSGLFDITSVNAAISRAIKYYRTSELIERRVLTKFQSNISDNEVYYKAQPNGRSRNINI
tara:strand:+ start:1512 stop:2396 length:885 start_codon:yes stop_codon:yes gene_type:complete